MEGVIVIDTLKIGIVGLGKISDFYARAIAQANNVELVAISTRNPDNLECRARQWNVKKSYPSYEGILADPDVEAVIIATPPNLHADMTIKALCAGKDVLCEKPPAMNAREAKLMMDCAKEHGRLLMYGLMFRFSEKYSFVRELCSQGTLGQIYYAKGAVLRRSDVHGGWFTRKEVSGGGPLMDYGPHIIDLAVSLMGNPEPESVFARTFRQTGNLSEVKLHKGYIPTNPEPMGDDVEELAVLMVNFKNGACLTIETSFLLHTKKDCIRLELYGDKGGMQVEPDMELYSVLNGYLVDMTPVVDCREFEYQQSIDRQVRHFADCARGLTQCASSAENGYKLMKIIDAAYASAESGKLTKIEFSV